YVALMPSLDSANQQYILKKDLPVNNNVEKFYFDTEGPNWIRSRWETDQNTRETIYPMREVLYKVYADSKPPVTTVDFNSTEWVEVNGKYFYSPDLLIDIKANDEVSKVENTFFSLNGDSFETYTSALSLAPDHDYLMKYYSLDRVGNAETPKQSHDQSFYIDGTPPTTVFNATEPKIDDIYSPKAFVTLDSDDGPGSGVKTTYYSIDGENANTYLQGFNLQRLNDGPHTIIYYSDDKVKNLEEQVTYDFYVDRIPPEVEVKIIGDQYYDYVSPRTTIKLPATDNKAGVKETSYKLASANFETFSDSITLDHLEEGLYNMDYLSTDNVENSSYTKTHKLILDTHAPKIDFEIDGPKYVTRDTIYIRDISTIKLDPYDIGKFKSGFRDAFYSLPGQEQQPYTEPFSLQEEGLHTINVSAFDQVNNEKQEELDFFVDNTPPEIFFHFSVDPIGQKVVMSDTFDIYPKNVQVYLAATDEYVGTHKIFYSLNNNLDKEYLRPVTNFKGGINVEVKVTAIDKLGNESEEIFSFTTEDLTVAAQHKDSLNPDEEGRH
ncbi:MAG: OmpL47-type beta-barrel domain-containing protein, partial [Cyclobacteriaceae bacterium]